MSLREFFEIKDSLYFLMLFCLLESHVTSLFLLLKVNCSLKLKFNQIFKSIRHLSALSSIEVVIQKEIIFFQYQLFIIFYHFATIIHEKRLTQEIFVFVVALVTQQAFLKVFKVLPGQK